MANELQLASRFELGKLDLEQRPIVCVCVCVCVCAVVVGWNSGHKQELGAVCATLEVFGHVH